MNLELDLRLDPYPMYAEMRKAPITFNPQFGAWTLFRYEDVRQVLNDHLTFSSSLFEGLSLETVVENSIQVMDPPRHTKLRALASFAFTPKAVAELQPRIREIAAELLDLALEEEEFDFVREFAIPFPVAVIAEMLGVPVEDRHRFKRWSDRMTESAERLLVGQMEELNVHVEAFREMRAYFLELIQARRAEPREDLITRLALAEIDGQRLTDAEAVDFCLLLMAAGNETTTNLLANGMRSFLESPEQWESLRQQPDLITQAIEEIFRFRAPAQCVFRVAKVDTTIGGQAIKAGERVAVFMGSANRDEAKFPDPERFDITRPVNAHLALGHGIHFCLGAPLARMEVRIALEELVKRLSSFRLAEGARLEPLATFVVFGLRSLRLAVGGAR